MEKKCTKCGQRKSLNEFHKHKFGRFGVHPICKKCRAIVAKIYHANNKEKLNAKSEAWNKNNKKKHRASRKNWRKNNKEKIKIYQKTRKNKMKIYCNIYSKLRRKTDPKFRLRLNIATAINLALKGSKNGRHWEILVGYTLEKLRKHLEKQFIEGMNWENYGKRGWEIDHKIPVSVFNFTKPEHEDFKKCWALKNLQPMWAKENNIKNNGIIKHFQPSLLI